MAGGRRRDFNGSENWSVLLPPQSSHQAYASVGLRKGGSRTEVDLRGWVSQQLVREGYARGEGVSQLLRAQIDVELAITIP